MKKIILKKGRIQPQRIVGERSFKNRKREIDREERKRIKRYKQTDAVTERNDIVEDVGEKREGKGRKRRRRGEDGGRSRRRR